MLSGLRPTSIFCCFRRVYNVPRASRRRGTLDSCYIRFTGTRNLTYHRSRVNGILVGTPTAPKCRGRPNLVLRNRLSVINSGATSYPLSLRGSTVRPIMSNNCIYTRNAALNNSSNVTITCTLTILSTGSVPRPTLRIILAIYRRINLLNTSTVSFSSLRNQVLLGVSSRRRNILATNYTNKHHIRYRLPVAHTTIANATIGTSVTKLTKKRSNARVRGNHTGTVTLLNH